MEFQASTDAMIIDVDTAKHVELLSSSMSKKKESSLYGVLNKCSTPGGSKLLRATLFQPPIKVNLMPCPPTGPKMFCAGPIFLCQTKNLFTYCGSRKHFVPGQKMICIQ